MTKSPGAGLLFLGVLVVVIGAIVGAGVLYLIGGILAVVGAAILIYNAL